MLTEKRQATRITDDFPFFVNTFAEIIRRTQKLSGTETGVLIKMIAKEIGSQMAEKIGSKAIPGILSELGIMLEKLYLGTMTVSQEKRTITVERCTGCERVPTPGESEICLFRASLLEAIFHKKLSEPVKVKHLYSTGSGTGHNTCHFQMSRL